MREELNMRVIIKVSYLRFVDLWLRETASTKCYSWENILTSPSLPSVFLIFGLLLAFTEPLPNKNLKTQIKNMVPAKITSLRDTRFHICEWVIHGSFKTSSFQYEYHFLARWLNFQPLWMLFLEFLPAFLVRKEIIVSPDYHIGHPTKCLVAVLSLPSVMLRTTLAFLSNCIF